MLRVSVVAEKYSIYFALFLIQLRINRKNISSIMFLMYRI